MYTTQKNIMVHDKLEQQDSIRALSNYLKIKYSAAEALIDSDKWVSYTETEAQEKAKEQILESLFAFNHWLLAQHSSAIALIPEDDWNKLASKMGEDFNSVVLALLKSESANALDSFIEDAISTDGIGHFISSFDHKVYYSDYECSCNLDQTYIIARQF